MHQDSTVIAGEHSDSSSSDADDDLHIPPEELAPTAGYMTSPISKAHPGATLQTPVNDKDGFQTTQKPSCVQRRAG